MNHAPEVNDAHSNVVRQRVTSVAFATVFLDLLGFGIIIPLLPLYVTDLGGDAPLVGWLLGLFSLAQLLATPWLGKLSDRWGRRPIIIVSLTGNALSMLLFAVAVRSHTLSLLFVSRTLAGITSGNIAACQAAVADVQSGAARAEAMGRVGAAIGLGIVVGPSLGGAASFIGPSAVPLLAAALATIDLVFAAFFMPETRHHRTSPASSKPIDDTEEKLPGATTLDPHRAQDEGSHHLGRSLAVILMIAFLAFLTIANVNTSLALLVRTRFGWSEREAALLFTLFGLGSLAAQGWLIRPLTERFGTVRLLSTALVATALAMATIGLCEEALALCGAVGAAGLAFGFVGTTLWVIASERTSSLHRGAALGLVQAAGGLGRTVGPPASGFLFARLGPSTPFLVAGASALLAAIATRTALRPGATETKARGGLRTGGEPEDDIS